MAPPKWKQSVDSLFRGDGTPVSMPTPSADRSLVRHILYLDGTGRETPYLSTTEQQATAQVFAGKGGRVWTTTVPIAKGAGLAHISKSDLLQLLKKKGKGRAKWTDAYEVMQARRYVEENFEHLLDSSETTEGETKDLRAIVDAVFS